MAVKRTIAVAMDLEWPYRQHCEIFAGIRDYAAEQGDWALDIGDFTPMLNGQGQALPGYRGQSTTHNTHNLPLTT